MLTLYDCWDNGENTGTTEKSVSRGPFYTGARTY